MTGLSTTVLPKDKPQIITTRLLNAPRELVWKVLTTPEHLKHFWGPDGFTNSFKSYDLRVDGEARFTMHGPDGKDWPNRFVFLTVDAPRLLRWKHDNGGEGEVNHQFIGEIELTDENGKTRIELRLNESSMEARDAIAKFALEGGRQNLERLAAYVAPMADPLNRFEIERVFPVSQKRLFEVCSQVEHLKHWMSPSGMTVIKATQDLKPGGTYHYGLAMADGKEMWGMVSYKEITPHSRLVYAQSFSDNNGGLTAHPMAPSWPLEVVTVFDFIPEGPNQTRLKIVWTNARVSDEEAKTFANAHGGMTQGWTGSLDKLYAYVLL
jgi:uncharacterized protein YndB with AHSA1/START domain